MAPKKRSAASKSSRVTKKLKKDEPSPAEIELEKKCINTIRLLGADMVEKACSGHPGAPMGCAPIAHLLWNEVMKYNPSNPQWINRDRFVLSNGHASALLYTMLHLTGYPVGMDDLKQFRQLDSITPGHPENFMTAGVEVSTGPLGQGISNAVGMAIAEKHLAATFNKEDFQVVDYYTYVLCGDGCLQEGVSSEASSLAGHLGLGKLIVCYDDNNITIDGNTDLSFTEDVIMRYESYGWHTQVVSDVSDSSDLREAIAQAKAVTDKPSIIKVKTVIGHGSSKQGTEKAHGAPLGAADLASVKTAFGFNPEEFFVVPEEVREVYASKPEIGAKREAQWSELFASYKEAHPELAAELTRRFTRELPAGWREKLPVYSYPETKSVATRNRSEEVLNALSIVLPELMGGSADLTHSNLTHLKCTGDFQASTPAGRYLRFGVREHGMAAICNGMFANGGVLPFCATFLNFIGYALGSVRLSALSRFGVIYVMSHDSIGQGEDGPTHQPIEMLESLRAMPNMMVFRPADGNEVSGSYEQALLHPHTPSVIVLSRQVVPATEGTDKDKVALGAYTIRTYATSAAVSEETATTTVTATATPDIVLVATGSELAVTNGAAEELSKSGTATVKVVTMPCWELFDKQPLEYKLEVFPAGVPVMSVEAGGIHGWQKYAHAPFGLETYGLSAPGGKLMERFGFTKDNLAQRAKEVIAFYAKQSPGGVPSLINVPKFPVLGHHA